MKSKRRKSPFPIFSGPFVWKSRQVRDFIDSLYMGYPTGYLIITQSPNILLKNGQIAQGEKIIIDGQQRIMALMTAILGFEVLDAAFQKKQIKIAFNPVTDDRDDFFKVRDNAALKDKKCIDDISILFKPDFESFTFIQEYCRVNIDVPPLMG